MTNRDIPSRLPTNHIGNNYGGYIMPKIYKRNCDQCSEPYGGYGPRFCSTECWYTWVKEQPPEPLASRFWAKVEIKGLLDCWLWTGCKHSDGYGHIRDGRKVMSAHRIAWELVYGSIPTGQYICHHCDVPACVNPNHLFIGSQKDNMDDMNAKGRGNYLKGEQNGFSKLTEENVLAIRSLGKQDLKHADIAKRFSIQRSQVSAIMTRRAWKHI